MGARVIRDEQELREVIKSGNVVVDFMASWCGPCKMLAPAIDTLAETKDNVIVVKADIDDMPNVSSEFGIMSVPTILSLKDGEIKERVSGFMPLEALIERLGL